MISCIVCAIDGSNHSYRAIQLAFPPLSISKCGHEEYGKRSAAVFSESHQQAIWSARTSTRHPQVPYLGACDDAHCETTQLEGTKPMSKKLTPAQVRDINKQYLPRLTVPNADALVQATERRSAKVRDQFSGELGLAYGDSPGQVLDIFPASNKNAPVFMFIHGGYWRARDLNRQTYSHVAKPFVQAGATVVLPDYDLCPDVRVTNIVNQVRAAFVWIYRNVRKFNGNPRAIYVCGHSAGGHLTGMLHATDWKKLAGIPNTAIKGAAPLSGLFDIEPHRHSQLQVDIRLSAREAKALSPLYLPVISRAPVIAAVGADEPHLFHWQSFAYAAHLRKHRVQADYVATPSDNHFTITDRLGRASDPLTKRIIRMMDA